MSTEAFYSYDLKSRLTGCVFNDGSRQVFSYDLAGNRTAVNEYGPAVAVDDPSLAQLRVSLTSGDPWGLTNVTNGGTLYIEPIYDKRIGVWNGLGSSLLKASSFSLSLAGKTAQNYRVYVWDSNADSVIDSAELVPWADALTPPLTDILVMDGYYVNAGATNRRAVADIMLHSTGQCDWTNARRGVCHIDERSRRVTSLTAFPGVGISWSLPASTSWRRINGGSVVGAHFVEFILSNSALVKAKSLIVVEQDNGGSGNYKYEFGFGLDVTNANSATQSFGHDQSIGTANAGKARAKFKAAIAPGKHALSMVEQNLSSRNILAYGTNNSLPLTPTFVSGMLVELML